MFTDLVLQNRSHRRFRADRPIDRQTLVELVDLARWVPSARNLQPVRYIISCDPVKNGLIFPCLTWPEIGDWVQPAGHERPTGYIILLGDTRIKASIGIDTGIAAQTIMLAATERGLSGCIIGIVDHKLLRSALNIPEEYRIIVVLALGVPAETVIREQGRLPDPTAFWRDEQDRWHVTKRTLDEVLLDL